MKSTARNPRKSLADNISRWARENIETIEPATIIDVKLYGKQRLVTVQPNVMNDKKDGDVVKAPKIEGCPVLLQGTAEGFMSFPLKVGDTVAIGYTKEQVEDFTFGQNTDPYEPTDLKLFGSSEAVVLGYWGQPNKDFTVDPENFQIKFYGASIVIEPGEVIKLDTGNVLQQQDTNWSLGSGNFFVTFNEDGSALINTTLDLVINAASVMANGAEITSGGNVITASGTDLDNLKANFDALVISYNAHGDGAPKHAPPVPPYTPV